MKIRWWMVGSLALVVGGILLVGRVLSVRERALHFVDGDGEEKNFGAFPPDIPETEFDGADFLT